MAAQPEPDVDPILRLPAAELAAAVNSGEIRAVEVIKAALGRIDARRDTNAFITVCHEEALARARELDRARALGRDRDWDRALAPTRALDRGAPGRATPNLGPLAGVPLAVKDLFDTAGIRTTAGSAILAANVSRTTAPAVARLEAAGAIIVGKTNMHEFAWGVTSQNPHYGTVANPALPGRVAGGSSGGNAAALADHQATIALGTDTGGSIRIPSACCGIVGFKPAYHRPGARLGPGSPARAAGSVSTRGVFPLAPSFDTVGPMARTVAETVLVESILTGLPIPAATVAGLHVGVLELTGIEPILRQLGARLDPAELPEPHPDTMAAFAAECAITHLRWFPSRRDEYGPDLQLKLDAAQRITAVEMARGLAGLGDFRRAAARALPFDLVIGPVMAIEPPAADCWEPDVRSAMTRWTRPFNFLGWPAIAIGRIQLAGRSRAVVLGAALALEQAGVVPMPQGPSLLPDGQLPDGEGPDRESLDG